ncbi:hypothetical protein WJ969_02605 [Achromobacter xylosoxidans]
MLLPTRLWPVCAVMCALAGCASGPPAAEDFSPAQVRPVEPRACLSCAKDATRSSS